MKRKGNAVWQGKGREGKGHLSTQSGALKDVNYTHASRFKDEPGTNPEELIAAAHAGCFSMKLSILLEDAGYTTEELKTESTVTIESGTIESSALQLQARVPGITKEEFEGFVRDAEKNCPVSKALNVKISVEYTLNG